MQSYFSYHVFSSCINSTHATQRFKRFFFKFATARRKQILIIGFRTIAAYLLLLTHPKFKSRILKNQLLVYNIILLFVWRPVIIASGDLVKCCDDAIHLQITETGGQSQ